MAQWNTDGLSITPLFVRKDVDNCAVNRAVEPIRLGADGCTGQHPGLVRHKRVNRLRQPPSLERKREPRGTLVSNRSELEVTIALDVELRSTITEVHFGLVEESDGIAQRERTICGVPVDSAETEVHHGLPWSRISDHAALSAQLAAL